ncbi:unnamed protein product [Aphis gossypii]|uniref:Uncharacterized protein n=1 Tax=Aphis gossypii TaxID=80765 RepID=A0A9P0NTG9_APHGO|nr:unnamed protein product [Aphis gossypii]
MIMMKYNNKNNNNNDKKHVQHAVDPVLSAAAVTKRYYTGSRVNGSPTCFPHRFTTFFSGMRRDDGGRSSGARDGGCSGGDGDNGSYVLHAYEASASTKNFAFSLTPARLRPPRFLYLPGHRYVYYTTPTFPVYMY